MALQTRLSSFNASVPMYLSLATLASIRSITLRVVLTPTSLVTRTSSKLSNTSASTLDFPTTALLNLSKKFELDFSKPLSKVAFLSDENMFLKKLISQQFLYLQK